MTTASIRPPDYLESAERYAGRSLTCREEIAVLLRAASDPTLAPDFDQVLFLAKFWEKATGILRRTGPDAGEVGKLAGELSDAAGKVSALLGKLFDAGAPSGSGAYRNRFLPSETGSLEPLGVLLADLALLKNYELHAAGR